MDPKKKLNVLKGSLESGIIDKEEYKKWEQKLDHDVREFDAKIEEPNKGETKEEPKKSSDKALVIAVAMIILILGLIFAFTYFKNQQPMTLQDLHVLNLKGKLKPEQGYVYKGVYSFVTLDNLWYTQIQSPKGTKIYSLALRYSPRDLKNIDIGGNLDYELFDNQTQYYVTFNPRGKELSYVALAVADFNTHMAKVFEKKPVAACDRNETEACKTRPIVTCDKPGKIVVYIKESDNFRTYYNNNCIVVEGHGFDLVKGVDRVLYNLYNMMEQKEA